MIEDFGRTGDGQSVQRVTLAAGGLTARVMTWGAVLQDLRLDGHAPPLVLGLPRFEDYPRHSPYFGAIAGRCANRIANASFALDGETFHLDPNFLGKHQLHGGSAGTGKRLWTLDGADERAARLSIVLEDGEMGYPGRLTARATFSLVEPGTLDILLEAETDRPTLCNLAHHSYFNLDGSPDVRDHLLQVSAEGYLPVDAELIPTGEVRPVADTPFDFRQETAVRRASDAGILDHNFCLSDARTSIRPVARLASPVSGVAMDIRTTEPGLQVYDGAKISVPVPGLEGQRMGAHAGIALEPQIWPDAIHHPSFPQAVLRPGETYRQHSQFAFSKVQP